MESTSPPLLMPGDRLLGLPELKRLYPKSTSGIYAEIRAGKFVAPVRIGRNRVAWIESQVLEHLNRLITSAGEAAA
ncbi:AlpA family phage regulatory protein [Thermomonas brevis]|uniref:AlpA family phage regulatory protein n=1 Tax=Thermomonas brevis TaxID=215691 RepID=A0A7G9QUM1_9GAMM|nr:AlpA family phage regulatory protein [Thermomonas brevis]QNN47046.1 AlpA family phage regulatory protein [Thermomonas brevis]